ncbi:hypothetical protein [Sphingobium sp. Cam5-1]|uniref:hypothetical protein n=1 Tax=Sphingobium sp. Cam5-1 TaxID=2789327 RepID=UPI0018AD17A9|nr:hypothetical protein [Sphingobium sp. Cam5-1]QPI73900.1 hypothetical protein IZV00_05395 [Sphingobium sp. Cam5-1]
MDGVGSLAVGFLALTLCLWAISIDLDRIADQGETMLCIEAAKAGVDLKGKLADACNLRAERRP